MSYRVWILCGTAIVAACSRSPSTDTPAAAGEAGAAKAVPASTPAAPVATPNAVALPAGASIEQATQARVGMTVSGEIVPARPGDFYRFENPLTKRDIVLFRLENKSATLKPQMKIYNGDRSEIVDRWDGTPGASVQQLVGVEPGQALYVQVKPAYESAGAYQLSAVAQQAYDSHEPNDDQLTPTSVAVGQPVEGGIMDARDHDWFRFTGVQGAKINIVLNNASTTLKPYVKVYSSTKSQKLEKYDATPGAGLDFEAEVDAGKDFYVQVLPYDSSGKYQLAVKVAP